MSEESKKKDRNKIDSSVSDQRQDKVSRDNMEVEIISNVGASRVETESLFPVWPPLRPRSSIAWRFVDICLPSSSSGNNVSARASKAS